MRPKIIHFVNQGTFGGTQHYILDLAQRQATNGHEVAIAAGEKPDERFINACNAIPGAKFHQLNHVSSRISPVKDIVSIFELRKLIRNIQPTIIHIHSPKLNLLTALAVRLLPVTSYQLPVTKLIYTVHGFWLNEPTGLIKYLTHYIIEWFGARLMDAVICVSNQDANDMKRAKIASRRTVLHVIHPALTPTKFPSRDEAHHDLQKLIPVPLDNKLIIGFIANLYPGKGARTLIDSMKMLQPEVIAVIIGEGAERTNYELQIANYGLQNRVFLLGYQHSASRFIPGFDLFTLPSDKEGLPITLLEANAAGVPVIATAVGGIPEIKQSNWILTQSRDASSLAKSLEVGLTLPRLKPKSLEQLQKEYDEFLNRTDEVYERVLSDL